MRTWHGEVVSDSVRAIQCYSDSSPVTGSELQGMVVEVELRNGRLRRVVLPAGTIHYGNQSAIAKSMSYVWATWLAFGPSKMHMEYFAKSVVC